MGEKGPTSCQQGGGDFSTKSNREPNLNPPRCDENHRDHKARKGQPQEVPTKLIYSTRQTHRTRKGTEAVAEFFNGSHQPRDQRRRKARNLRCCQWCELWSRWCFCFIIIIIIFKFSLIPYRCQPWDQNLGDLKHKTDLKQNVATHSIPTDAQNQNGFHIRS